MKIVESKIFDIFNLFLYHIQAKTDFLRKNSFILSNLDFVIFVAISIVLTVSLVSPTETIGIVSLMVPCLVGLRMLITKGDKIELTLADFFLILYFLICFISNLTSSLVPQSLYGFMKTSIYFVFYLSVAQFLKSNKNYIVYILVLLAILVSFESIIGISQNIVRVESIAHWQDTSYVNPEDIISRVYGTLKPYNPNLFAGWLVAAFPAVLGCFALLFKNLKSKKIYVKYAFIVSVISLLLAVLTIFLTGCRGAYIALFTMFLSVAIGSFLLIIFNKEYETYKNIWIKSVIGLLSAAFVFLLINKSILKRLLSIFIFRGDSSTSFRMNVYSSSIKMFQDNWLQGIGVGNKVFREIYGLYMMSGFDALSCYCIFLEMAVESGIFALIAFILFIGSLLYSGVKAFIKNGDLQYKILVFTAFISILAVVVHGFVDTVYFRPQIQFVFWTMAAILLTLVRQENTVK